MAINHALPLEAADGDDIITYFQFRINLLLPL